jgi:hypothetical protein
MLPSMFAELNAKDQFNELLKHLSPHLVQRCRQTELKPLLLSGKRSGCLGAEVHVICASRRKSAVRSSTPVADLVLLILGVTQAMVERHVVTVT